MIKVSDYVAKRLADWGVEHVFLVTGGGAMHLNDSFGNEPRIRYVCMHHEQAAAMAAEGYARITNTPGVINVTTGPGGINALNGVFGAWTDSIPMVIVSGQVKRETCKTLMGCPELRQLGDQEVDVVSMVRGITKYAALVDDPKAIRYHLEKAYCLAKHGRPGPCWIDIPVDVQGAQVKESDLPGFDHSEVSRELNLLELEKTVRDILERLRHAKRPVILAGTGVRLAQALDEFEQVIRALQIPVTTGWTHDLIASDDPLFCGRPGTIGERAGNFTVQNADLVLVLGSRLNIRQVSYNWASFAPKAFKIQVDVDPLEFKKPLVKPDLGIACDLKLFLTEMARQLNDPAKTGDHSAWLAWCRERVHKYRVVQTKQRKDGPPLNPYYFIELLSEILADDDVVVCGNATACIVPFQALPLRKGQRLFSNSGSASMGYDLPASIGAAFARKGGRVICLAGDGSLQMNVQELQTVMHYDLPVKIFVLNNNGYLSIRTTQKNFFGRLVGESKASGVSFPDMVRVADAFGIPAMRVDHRAQMDAVHRALNAPGPYLFDVMLDSTQEFEPRIRSRKLEDGTILTPALDDMYPFLADEEMASNRYQDADEQECLAPQRPGETKHE
jgi:acetolactate synthase-1/2/3 large subunit